jgi:putative NADH-flavin reductase
MAFLVVFVAYAVLLSVALVRAGFRSQMAPTGGEGRHRSTRVLIVGATGGTGRQLVTQALERGLTVTAFVRNPSGLQIDHPQLTVVTGDVRDSSSVEAAMKGQDAVLSALGHKQFFYPTRILSEGTRNILRAMEQNGVSRFVCETALGIGDSGWRMGLSSTLFDLPVIQPFYFSATTRHERRIAGSNVEWVITRPGVLTNGKKTGRYRQGRGLGSFLWTVRISRADVADFMLNQLTSDVYLRSAPGVCW